MGKLDSSRTYVRATDGHFYIVALETGDIDAAEAAVERAGEIAARYKLIYGLHNVTEGRLQLASVAGRFDEADALALESYEQSQMVREDAFMNYSLMTFVLRYLQGRAAEIVDVAVAAADDVDLPALSFGIPPGLIQCGRFDEARERYDRVARDGFRLPLDPGWSAGMALVANACASLRDAEGARVLYERLLPVADQAVATALYYMGSHHHYLGDLASTFGDLDAAMGHYTAAEAWETRMRAPVWTATARAGQAEVLMKRGEAERAREIATSCREIGEAHSAFALLRRAEAVLAPHSA
jgi:tetratricopeptide (TPR) repeat protein